MSLEMVLVQNVMASHDNGVQIIYQSPIDFDAIPKKALAYTT